MKSLFLILMYISCSSTLKEFSIEDEWDAFLKLHGKHYTSNIEKGERFNIFKNNVVKIKTHNSLYNAGNITYKLGINQFADWTSEEFLKYVNNFRFSKLKVDRKIHQRKKKNGEIPDFFDWRLHWAVTEVRNQGHCGSCWAFSAVGTLEGQAKIHLGKRIRLSEQNLVDCADNKYGNYGCNGGDENAAFLYVENYGIQSEDSYHYVAQQGPCRQSSAELYVVDYYSVNPTEDALKEAVASVGPISVAIDSTVELQHYSEGVFFDRTCSQQLNHAVLVIGYGTDGNDDYWLVKNSWGPSWGEQGYFRLARNKYNNCGIASYASYPTVSEKKA